MYTCIYTDISYLLKKTCLYIKCYTNPFCCLATWVAQTVDNQGSLTGARRQHWSWQTLGLLRGHHPVMLARPITCQSRCTWARRGGDKFMDVYGAMCTLFEMTEGKLLVTDPDAKERLEPVLERNSWNHANGFLRSAFYVLHKPKENQQNTNWFAHLAVKNCVKLLLNVNDDGEVSAAWPMSLRFWFFLFCWSRHGAAVIVDVIYIYRYERSLVVAPTDVVQPPSKRQEDAGLLLRRQHHAGVFLRCRLGGGNRGDDGAGDGPKWCFSGGYVFLFYAATYICIWKRHDTICFTLR